MMRKNNEIIWKLTVLPMVCLGPTVTSNLPEPPSLKLILCRKYTGIATMLENQWNYQTIAKIEKYRAQTKVVWPNTSLYM